MHEYVIDRSGQRKRVPPGYVLQDGERTSGSVLRLGDGAPARQTVILNDAGEDARAVRDAAYQRMLDGLATAYLSDDGGGATLPRSISDALSPKGRSVLLPAIAAVNAAKGNPAELRFAIDQLRSHANGLLPSMPGHMTTDAEQAVYAAQQWVSGFCTAASAR